MPHTSSDGIHIYSVEMAQRWMNEYKDSIHVSVILIDDLEDQLYDICWTDQRDNQISPMHVMRTPGLYPVHAKRTKKAKLKYPILLYPNGAIFDGMHRLLKAYCKGYSRIEVITIPKNILRNFLIRIETPELYNMDLIRSRNYMKTIKKLYKIRFLN